MQTVIVYHVVHRVQEEYSTGRVEEVYGKSMESIKEVYRK